MTAIFFIAKILLAIFIVLFVIELSLKNKYIVLYMTIVAFIITTYEWVTSQTLRLSLQVIQLDTSDLLTIYLIAMAILLNLKKTQRNSYPKLVQLSLYLAFGVFLLSMFRGFFHNNFAYVIEDIRRLMESFFIPIICYMYLPIDLEDAKVRKIIGGFTKCIVIYCTICWVLDLGLGIKVMPPQSDAGSTMRVLAPEQVLIVAMITIYKIYHDLIREKRQYISNGGFALIALVILLQHRSVWIALAIGLIYILVKCNPICIKDINKKTISIKFLLQLIFLFLCIPICFFLFRNSNLLTQLQMGLDGVNAENGSTLNYREQLWTAHLSTLNLTEWLIGKPFGSGYLIHLTGYMREITPHSAYIQTIIRCGIVGAVFVVTFVLITIRQCSKKKYIWGTAMCLMLLVFWYPYSYNLYDSIGFAFILKSFRLNRGEMLNE
ncbi:hypothetical protein CN367_17250 [Priestia megaterium]|uniref:hypothetical protein n=1 Tax=Priestia megaterium TaxID=1404 RepID=UPI000BF77AE6|nr:hypothetical protein [Priestia megaterium]MED4618008.1 hypothetical protein [Priestia megaterium]PEZ45477.1 hypothetical protein CN367_17250 [Priestia megaterium]